MQKIKSLFVLLVALIAFTPVMVAAAGKVAYVDLGPVIIGSEAAQAKGKELVERADYVALTAKVEGLQADLKAMQEEASKALGWSDEQNADFAKKFEYMKADLQLEGKKLQAEQKQIQQIIATEFQSKALKAIDEVAKSEGLTMVVRSESLVWGSPEVDITSKVLDVLNKKEP